jgi:hypothetical protein
MSVYNLEHRRRYKDVSVSYTILAATDYTTASSKITGKAGYTIYIQKITVGVTTDNAATQLFQDSAGTPIEVAKTKASPGLGPIDFDFGDEGFALTEGKDFQHKMSAAGLAASITVMAYMKPTGTLVPANI